MPTIVKEDLKTEEEKEKVTSAEEEVSFSESETKSTKKEKKKGKIILLSVLLSALSLALLGLGIFFGAFFRSRLSENIPAVEETEEVETVEEVERYGFPEWIEPMVLTLDGFSRSGEKLEAINDIAVHYVANPGSSALANRNYFEGPDSNTSSHFIVGLDGEILLCIPPDEKSCATKERNIDTLSVEVCHPDETGEFSEVTRESLVRLLAYLCDRYGLTEENLIRHYDVTGKLCPKFYVENSEEWEALKEDVKNKMQEGEF
ncbi:MAG: N-acetylmuramoyl-L-alanine amidase [Clostridia bacterium]|nr:N-acetylmuramoyl-L-alanine amidase [Clostridia bacterium]